MSPISFVHTNGRSALPDGEEHRQCLEMQRYTDKSNGCGLIWRERRYVEGVPCKVSSDVESPQLLIERRLAMSRERELLAVSRESRRVEGKFPSRIRINESIVRTSSKQKKLASSSSYPVLGREASKLATLVLHDLLKDFALRG